MAKAKSKSKPKPKKKPLVKAKVAASKSKTTSKTAKKPAKTAAKKTAPAKQPGKAASNAPVKAAPVAAMKPPEPKATDRGQSAPPEPAPEKTILRPTPVRRDASQEERDTSVMVEFPKVGKREVSKMPHIDDATLGKITAKLNEMQAESKAIINQQMQSDLNAKEEVNDVGDDMDQAMTERDREFNLLMHQRHLRRLQQINEAFQRIEDGTYGFCEGTDEPINPRRLVIMPLARYSLEYQEQQEKTHGRSPEDSYSGSEESFAVEE